VLVEGTEQAMEKDFSEVLGGITRGEMGEAVEKQCREAERGGEEGL